MSSTFIKEIGVELDAIKDDLNRAMSNTLVDAHSFVTSRSAVDTGRYRAAWNISKDAPDNSVPAKKKRPAGHQRGVDLYGMKGKQRILFNIMRNKSIILSNNVEYAQDVDARYGDTIRAKTRMKAGLRHRLRLIK